MRSETQDSIKMSKKDQLSIDIIQQTKKLVRDMDEKQRFAIAR